MQDQMSEYFKRLLQQSHEEVVCCKDEMKDLEKLYAEQLEKEEEQLEFNKSFYLRYFQDFIDMNTKVDELKDKLQALRKKMESTEDEACI